MINIDETFMKGVGERVKELRDKAHLSQKELANVLTKDSKTISRWECGENLPDTDSLVCISEFFNVTTDYILYGKELSDENSFTWYDNFKRLNRLYDTMEIKMLRSSENHSDVYLQLLDDEAKEWFERIDHFELKKRNKILNGIECFTDIKDLDALFEDFIDDKTQLLSREEKQRRQWVALNAVKPLATITKKEDNDEIVKTLYI